MIWYLFADFTDKSSEIGTSITFERYQDRRLDNTIGSPGSAALIPLPPRTRETTCWISQQTKHPTIKNML